jgi:sialic acid synthase SpsE
MLQEEFFVGKVKVTAGGKPYIIAEIGSNHDQSLDKALKIIDMAVEAGAHAVKFQLFKARKMYPVGTEMYNIFKSIELDTTWLPTLVEHCRKAGVEFMTSPFDKASAVLLHEIGVRAFKIASSEVTKAGLLSCIASFSKPMFISTGMCDLVDVHDAVTCCLRAGNTQVALLQCGAMYPLPEEYVNLRVIDTFSKLFNCPVGLSDHTSGMTAAVAAIGRGACVIEKHITLDKNADGPDHFFAMEPSEFNKFIEMINDAYKCLGSPHKKMLADEREKGRREGIYAARDIAKGDVLKKTDILVQGPAVGIRKRHLLTVLGATSRKSFPKGSALLWDGLRLK